MVYLLVGLQIVLASGEKFMNDFLDRAEKVIGIIPCEECGHSLSLHFDRYGCEYELGDCEGDESGPAYARGNCGCKAENLSDDGNDAFILLRDLRQLRILAKNLRRK